MPYVIDFYRMGYPEDVKSVRIVVSRFPILLENVPILKEVLGSIFGPRINHDDIRREILLQFSNGVVNKELSGD